MSGMAYRVRTAEDRDVETIVGLWREFIHFHEELDDRLRTRGDSAEWFAAFLRSLLGSDRDRVVVAETAEGEVVGYAIGRDRGSVPIWEADRFAFVSDIYVDIRHRRRGVATALFGDLRDWFQKRGLASIELEVVHLNPVSQAFWRALGFTDFVDRLRRGVQSGQV